MTEQENRLQSIDNSRYFSVDNTTIQWTCVWNSDTGTLGCAQGKPIDMTC